MAQVELAWKVGSSAWLLMSPGRRAVLLGKPKAARHRERSLFETTLDTAWSSTTLSKDGYAPAQILPGGAWKDS